MRQSTFWVFFENSDIKVTCFSKQDAIILAQALQIKKGLKTEVKEILRQDYNNELIWYVI